MGGTKNGIRKRLEALEEHTFGADPFRDFPDWDLTDQFEAVADTLAFFRQFHADGEVRYPATDREIYLLGLLCAVWELGGPGAVGEHRFPSDLEIAWRENGDGTYSARCNRQVRLEDLPEGVRLHFERMAPQEQPERERFLYEDRHRAKKDRERMRWHDEHGWDEPTPKHLRTWEPGGEGGS